MMKRFLVLPIAMLIACSAEAQRGKAPVEPELPSGVQNLDKGLNYAVVDVDMSKFDATTRLGQTAWINSLGIGIVNRDEFREQETAKTARLKIVSSFQWRQLMQRYFDISTFVELGEDSGTTKLRQRWAYRIEMGRVSTELLDVFEDLHQGKVESIKIKVKPSEKIRILEKMPLIFVGQATIDLAAKTAVVTVANKTDIEYWIEHISKNDYELLSHPGLCKAKM